MPITTTNALRTKLHPSRFPNMSPRMMAILGCILGRDYTSPSLDELAVTSDGFLLGQRKGDVGLNEMLGTADDLERNWSKLLDCAGLTPAEHDRATVLYQAAVKDWRV